MRHNLLKAAVLAAVGLAAGDVYKIVSAPEPVAGDRNGDCQVDFTDLSLLAQNWMVGK